MILILQEFSKEHSNLGFFIWFSPLYGLKTELYKNIFIRKSVKFFAHSKFLFNNINLINYTNESYSIHRFISNEYESDKPLHKISHLHNKLHEPPGCK